jgi:hypothetical protein
VTPEHILLHHDEATLWPGGCGLSVPEAYERALSVRQLRLRRGEQFEPGPFLHLLTAQQASTVVMLGGAPVGPRHVWWNFVSSRKERIEQAKADWTTGRIALPPADAAEWIPLPEGAA